MRVGVLISGGGTNLQSLIDRAEQDDSGYQIAAVISNRADAFGLERARRYSIPSSTVDHRQFELREAFERELDEKLRQDDVEFVCLAGFMRVLTPWFVNRWHNRLINIHPSLLPAFPGLHTHKRVLKEGCRVSGCTVHFVRAELDHGPIIVQGVVPVMPGDDSSTLAARVLEIEHQCYPTALTLISFGRIVLRDDIVIDDELPINERLILHSSFLKILPEFELREE